MIKSYKKVKINYIVFPDKNDYIIKINKDSDDEFWLPTYISDRKTLEQDIRETVNASYKDGQSPKECVVFLNKKYRAVGVMAQDIKSIEIIPGSLIKI